MADAQTTSTWDFTDNTKWSTIAAATGTVYYATDGSTSTSTAFDASTAVCMQVTNAFTQDTDKGYKIGGHSTTTTDGNPDFDYISIKVPAGYTITVNGGLPSGNNYGPFRFVVDGTELFTHNVAYTYADYKYVNNSASVVTAYFYTKSSNGSRQAGVKTITLTSNESNTLTAITGNTSWDFTNCEYGAYYDGGAFYDKIYYGSDIIQSVNTALYFRQTGNTETGEGTVQIKIPAKQTIGLLVKMGGTNSRKSYIKDNEGNTLLTVNTTNGNTDQTVSIASSENERTLYFYNSNADASHTTPLYYIHAYTKQSVSIGSTGWATLYTPCALDFSGVSGLKAYTATCSESVVTLTEVSNVPAGTGIVLKGTPNTNYDIPVTGSSSTAKGHLTGAFLTATSFNAYSASDPAYTLYVLTPVNEGANVKFNPVTSGSIAAGKAFLKINGGASALSRSLNVVFADETTGISQIENGGLKVEDSVYNLGGQRVAQTKKGLYIVNGKKVIIK